MSNKPSKILGINKGLLQKGYLADLVLLDLEKEYTVDSNNFYSKGKFTPINGKKYFGIILKTFHHGNMVYPF
jgi:dihydroorotase